MNAVEDRFWAKVDKRGPDDCWPWVGAISGSGYGSFQMAGKRSAASRLAFQFTTGNDPGALSVLHTCDNRPCCNPAHLYAGTVKDNSRDMMERGRWRSGNHVGSANGYAKLTEEAVIAIRGQIAAGRNNKQIARDFGVTHQMISKIRRGHFWRHVGQTVAQTVAERGENSEGGAKSLNLWSERRESNPRPLPPQGCVPAGNTRFSNENR